jgi:hypothetical protein
MTRKAGSTKPRREKTSRKIPSEWPEDTVTTGVDSRETHDAAVGHASKTVEEAKAFTNAISESVTSLSASIDLRGRVERSPLAMVSAALGVGYVLGGGLFSSMTRRLLKVGAAAVIIPFAKKQLAIMVGSGRSTASVDERPASPQP